MQNYTLQYAAARDFSDAQTVLSVTGNTSVTNVFNAPTDFSAFSTRFFRIVSDDTTYIQMYEIVFE
jgi:hypothetical protein